MSSSPVIYTDLDGTLLDHDTYSANEAKEILGKLSASQVPVIPATSKTYAEVADFREQMSLDHAFIVENGAAVYVPMSLNIRCPMGSKIFEDYWVREFGVRRQALCDVIEALDMSSHFDFKSLNEMRAAEVAEITGLDLESAKRAQMRLYSETIDWRDTSEALQKFKTVLTDIGFAVSHGGRFVHLMGPNNKGIAARWFQNLLKREWTPDLISIAAGDAPNDREMLEGADFALVMRNDRGTPLVLERSGSTYVSDGSGPNAWAAGIREIFKSNGWRI
jgi:mannosyl-3-phosphoglycerate phosphatase family protein